MATMSVSFWSDSLVAPPSRPALTESIDADFVIIGGGFTGLWTGIQLLELEPTANVILLEAKEIGFGASGRNGGWLSALFPANLDKLSRLSNADSAITLQREMFETVSRTGRYLEKHAISADWYQGGTFVSVRTPVQLKRAEAELKWWRDWGFGEEDFALLDKSTADNRILMSNQVAASFTPHCARVHPLKLVRGLAERFENLGGQIFENSAALTFDKNKVQLANQVEARAKNRVIRATEAWTSSFAKQKREIAPVYSLMIATEPLPQSFWDEVGLARYETFSDYRHLIIYGQRTADDRLAFGGRGAPYHFNSSIELKHELHPPTHDGIWQELTGLFPALHEYSVTHRWGGALGIARDWMASVGIHKSGFAHAGGYVGDGLGTSALAGLTLAELLTERTTVRTGLPWVNHRSRKWEPEPLRWLGVNAGLQVMSVADGEEKITNRESLIASTFDRLLRS
jgi:glycine/D-amino acid oxidase-like deaminating enzyme